MGRKKRFDTQAGGFLWWTWAVKKVEDLAAKMGLTPSDVYRAAMAQYFDVQEGRLILAPNDAAPAKPEIAQEQPMEA